jgi:hypothetical protein
VSAVRAAIARSLNISERSIDMAVKVRRHGVPELETAIMAGNLKLAPAYLLADEPPERQREILATVPPRKIAALLRAERRPATADLRQPCPHCNGSGFEPTGGAA